MAIGPNYLNEKIVKECKEIESIIDNNLKVASPDTDGSYIIDRPEQLLAAHWNILCDKYITAGWHTAKLDQGSIKFIPPIEKAAE